MKRLSQILNPSQYSSVMMALNILDYLYEAEIQDYRDSKYPDLRKILLELAQKLNEGGWTPSDSNKMNSISEKLGSLQIRFYARMTAYLSTIHHLDLNLEEIFCKKYIENKDKNNNQDISDRKEEVKKYSSWRNKVFAHLACSAPRPNENQTFRDTVQDTYGGSRHQLMYEDCLTLSYVPVPDLEPDMPDLTIVRDYQEIKNHYQNWENTFLRYENDRAS